MEAADRTPREATAEEAKALGHPLRIQILQLLREELLTNKEIADRLKSTPGATLHHINLLVRHGFAETSGARTGRRGAKEVPYTATGKTMGLTFPPGSAHTEELGVAILDSAIANYRLAPPDDRFGETSVALYLNDAALTEFRQKLQSLIDEYKDEQPAPDAPKYGIFCAGYKFP